MVGPDQSRFYRPLKSCNGIRLLRRGNDGATTPNLVLEEYDISSCPEFVAISYTWSPPYFQDDQDKGDNPSLDFSAKLLIDGETFYATQNMLDALTCALQRCKSEYFWMDQCCINQTSTVEKGRQVSLMHKIYEQAKLVLVWLGGSHEYGRSFQWMLDKFASLVTKLLNERGPHLFSAVGPAAVARFASLSLEEYNKMFSEAESYYSLCRYFERTWVRQEIILANDIIMFCGDLEIAADGLRIMFNCFSNTSWYKFTNLKRSAHNIRRGSAFGAFGIWTTTRLGFQNKTSSIISTSIANPTFPFVSKPSVVVSSLLGLWQIVSKFQQSTCSDPRDKIYAALPLAARMFESRPRELLIQPDYDISAERLYINFCTLIICETESLTILAHVDDISERELILPSWVKDFSSRMAQSLVDRFKGRALQTKLRSMALRQTVVIRDDRLTSFGCRFATISKRSSDPRIDPPEKFIPSCLALIADQATHLDRVPRLEALWRTLLNDSCFEQGFINDACTGIIKAPAPEEVVHDFRAWLCTQLAMDGMNRLQAGESIESISSALVSLLQPFQKDLPNWDDFVAITIVLTLSQLAKDVTEFQNASHGLWSASAAFDGMFMNGWSRPLFMTQEGFIGNGLLDMQVGDEVWFVHSCAVPLLFRPRTEPDTYTLIGGCYLHGFMYDTHVLDPGYDFVKKWRKFTLV